LRTGGFPPREQSGMRLTVTAVFQQNAPSGILS
jgi:hypothetical protein